jgi:hypothetical protein
VRTCISKHGTGSALYALAGCGKTSDLYQRTASQLAEKREIYSAGILPAV